MRAGFCIVAAAVLIGALSGCGPNTYVVLTFERGDSTPAGITELDVSARLALHTATTTFTRAGAEIVLPTTGALRIGSGSGLLLVQAVARDSAGNVLDSGAGSGTVTPSQRTDVTVKLGRLAVDRLTVDFGTVAVGASGSETVVITNHAGDPIGPLTTTIDGEYAIGTDGCANLTLQPGASCMVEVAFMPTDAGAHDGALAVAAGADDLAVALLTGVGQPAVTLTVNFMGPGSGTVTASVPGIVCNATSCSISVLPAVGTPPTITFTPVPDFRSNVGGWSDGCSGTGTCSLVADVNKSATVAFGLRPPSLKVRVIGSGTVTSTDGQIDCGGASTKCGPIIYPDMNSITMVAAPAAGSAFIGWGGGGSTCPSAAQGGCKLDPCANVVCAPGEECQDAFCHPPEPLCASLTCPVGTRCVLGTCVGESMGCSGPIATCTMQVPPDLALTATFGASRNYAFTTSATFFLTTLGGLTGIDAKCQQAAQAANLPGTYKAWLSTISVPARTRVGSGGWYRTDGRLFAASLTNLIGSPSDVIYPLRLDESGNDFGLTSVDVATGTTASGDSGNNCNDYTQSTYAITLGSTTANGNLWTDRGTATGSCATPQHIFCFRTDGTATPLALPSTTGRRVFVTTGAFDPSRGTVGADALCQAEASAAGLQSSTGFVAFMATPSSSAAARLDLSPGTLPFVRIDGVQVVERPFDLAIAGGSIIAGINVGADGSYQRRVAWTGASDPTLPGTLDSTCDGWTSNSSQRMGRQGFEEGASSSWFSSGDAHCNYPVGSVLCFEQ
jgi:hypothetical protein